MHDYSGFNSSNKIKRLHEFQKVHLYTERLLVKV